MKIYQPGPAIWKTKDVDRPVVVVQDLGQGPDGRLYVAIEGSAVGIPLDELEAVKTLRNRSEKPKQRQWGWQHQGR